MADNSSTSSLNSWLADVLSGWTLPILGVVVVAAAGGLHLLGALSEEALATTVVLAVGLGVGLYLLRPALDGRRDGLSRGLAAAAALVTALATVVPAMATTHPGHPLFSGAFQKEEDAVALPPGLSGAVRVMVSGKLPERGDPEVGYVISGTQEPVDGTLKRTYNNVRVGRGSRARVAHDHTADLYRARIPAGTPALKLDRLVGQLDSPLAISIYRDPLPFTGGPWILAALAVLLAAVAEARLGLKSDPAVWSGMAVAFSLLVTFNATPAAAVGPAIGGVVLGGILGALGGWFIGAVVRRFVPAAPARKGPAARTSAA